MDSLAELNLRRNRIRTVVEVDSLPNLQRLFLSYNEISRYVPYDITIKFCILDHSTIKTTYFQS